MSSGRRLFRGAVITALLLVVLLASVSVNVTAADGTVKLYMTPESEHLPIGHLLSFLLESKIGLEVDEKIQYSDVGLRKIVNGEGDLFIGLNLPPAGEVAWDYDLNQLCNLGPVYEDAIKGWAVPDYVAEEKLDSLVNLKKAEVKTRLHREILTYKSRDNLLELSRDLIDDSQYLNDYKLVVLREMVANSELNRATMNEEWIMMTMKRPSVPYSLYNVRFIEYITDEQSVHLVGRSDLMAAFPSEVTKFLSRFYLPISLVNELVRMHDKDQDSAVRDFVDENDQLVKYWLEGVESL
ncbi:hypothetical protein KGY71_05225 [Candidatus Bipolaricaulota bacterium]|nr:hypothetical protein [Candidatus Bipolaricaulota bacterium]